MKTALRAACLLFVATAIAQQTGAVQPNGTIHGTAVGRDGKPVPHLHLEAAPLGVPLGTVLPGTITNDKGEYRFQKLPWWGRYTVRAEDEDAGYSSYSGTGGTTQPTEVELTPEQRERELRLDIPQKAAFLKVNLTNRSSGAPISAMAVRVMRGTGPSPLVFSISCASSKAVLLPPGRDLLIHVTSHGYREWDESVGIGKPIHAVSGSEIVLNVQLEPI
jgi:hypothetical protein